MRAARFLIFLAACGDPPIKVSLNIVTPANDASRIANMQYQLLTADGKTLAKSQIASDQKGKFSSITFDRPAKTDSAVLKATSQDANGNTLGVGQTNLDLTKTVLQTVTLFMSSSINESFTAHPFASTHKRFFGTAVTLPSGIIWLFGGVDETNTPQPITESYNPFTLAFADGPSLQTPCLQPTAIVANLNGNDYIIVAGGHTPTNEACQGLQVIEPVSGNIGQPVALLEPRRDSAAFTFSDGSIAFVGGAGGADTATSAYVISLVDTDPLKIRVDVSNVTLAAPATQAFGATFGSDLYLAGDSLAIQKLNPTSGAFSTVGNFAPPRSEPAVFAAGAQAIYTLAGGRAEVERWSLGGNAIVLTSVQDNPHAPAALEIPGTAGPTLIVSGGTDDSGNALSTALFYDLSGTSPSLTGRQHVTARSGHVLLRTVTNTLLVVGGNITGPNAELFSLP